MNSIGGRRKQVGLGISEQTVTERRNTSLEMLGRGFRRAPFQARTDSAPGEACGRVVARTLAPRGTASTADLSGGGMWVHTPASRCRLGAPGPLSP